MTRVLITGGRGSFGRELTPRLLKAGYTVRITSRSKPTTHEPPNLESAQLDLRTATDLTDVLAGVDMLVHAASDPFHTQEVDVLGTARLLEGARAAGVRHFVYISIVGIDRIQFSYYQQKLAAERLVEQGAVPWSILRVTQFHSLIDRVLQPLKRIAWSPVFLLPKDLQSQPIDEGEVAHRFVEIINAGPGGRWPDIGGPEVLRLGEMATTWLAQQGLSRPVLGLYLPGKMAQGLRQGRNTDRSARYGRITWQEWLAARYGQPAQQPVAALSK
jgi:uncharacterized protein YbjT (DUF2867 family)